ncbi:WD40 containing domain protein [Mycena venus]|uniref:WD40 containing domain protein n=1 Tax=Mycena venus TaxID=2733690 RepID=A0A8H7CGL6_9AGAR|nr:WD40 containing domain protein [Mycena venus]
MEQNGPSALEREPVLAVPSGPQMFPNATQFGLNAAQLTNVQGVNYNLNVNQMPSTMPSLIVPGTQQGRQIPQMVVPSTASPQAVVYSESGNYSCQLLRQGRGFPLYVPRDVAIGDLGRLTPEGIFEVFFNIYNANLPEDLVPLSPYDPKDVVRHDFSAGNYVASASVREFGGGFAEFPGGDFLFSRTGPDGAVLALPHGARQVKLENRESMQQYAVKHAESWYKYVNGTRGRGLVNGSLFLVTGYEKARSWGMASFQDVSLQNEFQLSFRPTTDADNGYRYRWHAPYCHRKHADSPSVDGSLLNQTTFIHAFAISVCEGFLGRVLGTEVCQRVDSSTFPDKSGRSFVPYGSQGYSFIWSFFASSASGRGKQNTMQAPTVGNGMVSEAFPLPEIFHPSQIIHERILREAPHAKVVITHDDDWRDVFRDDGMRTTHQNFSELQQTIFERFQIMEEDGAAFLMPKSHTIVSRNVATMTVGEERRDHRPTATDDPSDIPRPLPETALGDISRMASDQRLDCDYIADFDYSPHSPDNFRIQLDPHDSAFNLGSHPFPHTPLYNGSYHNQPYSSHSELSFSGEQESFNIYADDEAPVGITTEYDPSEYDDPQQSSLLIFNDNDHSSPSSDGGGNSDEGKRRSRASSVSSNHIQVSPRMSVAQAFDSMTFRSPNWGTELLPCDRPPSPQSSSTTGLLVYDNAGNNSSSPVPRERKEMSKAFEPDETVWQEFPKNVGVEIRRKGPGKSADVKNRRKGPEKSVDVRNRRKGPEKSVDVKNRRKGPGKHVHFSEDIVFLSEDGVFPPTPSLTSSSMSPASSYGPFTPPNTFNAYMPLNAGGQPISVHEALEYTGPTPFLCFDVTLHPKNVEPSRKIRTSTLLEPATKPGLPSLVLTHPRLGRWQITARPEQGKVLLVRDVLSAIYTSLRQQATAADFEALPPVIQSEVAAAFSRRWMRMPTHETKKVEKSKGLKRVDFLGSTVTFVGISQSQSEPNCFNLLVV